MKIEPDKDKLQIEPDKPDYAEEIAKKTAPPTLDQDSLETGDSGNIFQQPFPGVKAPDENVQKLLDAVEEKNREAAQEELSQPKPRTQSTGGGGTASATSTSASTTSTSTASDTTAKASSARDSETKTSYQIIDSSFGKKPVVIGGEGDKLPDDLRDLGTYDGGKDIIEGDFYLHQRTRVSEASGSLGRIYNTVQLQAGGLQGRIFYTSEASLEDLTLKGGIGAEAKIELVGVYSETGYTTPSINLAGHDLNLGAKLNVDFSVSAKGFVLAEASVGKDTYLKIGGEAFVGATWTVEGEADVGEFADAHAGFDAYAGIGAKGGVTIGFEDGEVTVDFGAGLAIGYGIGFDAGVDVDLVEIGETLYDLGEGGAEAAGAFGGWMSGVLGAGGEATGDFLGALGDFAGDAYDAAADTAGDVVDTVVDTAEDAGEAVVDAAEDTAEAVGDAISDAADW